VAAYHFNTQGVISALPLVRHSWIFVDYFFVLSGFVIAFSYGERIESRRISVGKFMMLRLGRIYPLHIAVLAAFILLDVALYFAGGAFLSVTVHEPFTGPRNPSALISNIFLLHSFGIEHEPTWNGPSWSIAAEVWSYLLFALIFLAPKKIIPWIAATLSLGGLIVLFISKPSIEATYDLGFVRCVYGFGLGFLLYRLFRKIGPLGGHAAELASLASVVLFVSLAEGRWTFAAPPVFALEIYVLASARGFISRTLTYAPFQLLGLVSYSIYMIHIFLEARLVQLMHVVRPQFTRWDGAQFVITSSSPLVGDLILISALALLVLFSYASYRLIEKPGRDFVRNRLNRREGPSRQLLHAPSAPVGVALTGPDPRDR
jgi:peptidoglycan/LPS O-acetylase OafA/YrhL